MITIDASVLVAAGSPDDPAQADAAAFLVSAISAGVAVHQPTLALVEVSAAVARRTGDHDLAREAGAALLAMPGLVLHSLDLDASAEAAALAAQRRLRAADSVYAAIAARHEATLVTLDDELRDRSRAVVDAVGPREWLDRGLAPADSV
jgi:predicted nucleic acid-binding protein